MSKSKYVTKEIRLTKGTILQQFKNYVKKNMSVDEIIGFISVTNARLLCTCEHGLSEKDAIEIVEFVDYFMENYYEKTKKEIKENWPDDPLIFRLANQILENDLDEQIDYLSSLMTYHQLKSANNLCNLIFDIRENRIISITAHIDGSPFRDAIQLKKYIPAKILEREKKELYRFCCLMLLGNGAIVVRVIYDRDDVEIFGVRTNNKGEWEAVNKKEMYTAFTTDPDGNRIPLEKGVTITEIPVKRKQEMS